MQQSIHPIAPHLDPLQFRDKRIVVTGAARGIGRAVAERFARLGARVAVLDIDAAALKALQAQYPQGRGAHSPVLCTNGGCLPARSPATRRRAIGPPHGPL